VLETIRRNWEGTPFWRLLGITVEEVRPSYARLAMPDRVELNNAGGGGLHGGSIASLIDVAVSAVLWTVYDIEDDLRSHTTIELNVSYLEAGFGPMTAEARGLRKGRSVFVGTVDVRDGKGSLVATGRAAYRVWLTKAGPGRGDESGA
jgi:uncharacterized protein (TIGR00369 family)